MNDPKRVIVVLLGLVFVGMCTLGIKGHMDSVGYKNQVNYTTAIQATKSDDFNYIVDSQQGRVLANGMFIARGKLAQFPEMNRGYLYVGRTKEHYTMHTYTTCSKNSCTTHVYYSWDSVGSEELRSDNVAFMGRNYSSALFNFHAFNHDTGCDKFAPAGTGGFFHSDKGCLNGNYYLNDDDRYVYSTVPTLVSGSFLATTYGGLKPFNEDRITVQNKDIGTILKDIGKYQLISFWAVTILLIIITICAGIGAYYWVMEDGVWSLNE